MQNHFLNLNRLRKIFLYAGATVLGILIIAAISAYLLRDRIVNRFIQEANKHLATPVKIGKMDLSLLAEFPNMSIEFTDVYVEDSHPEVFPLFTAKKVSFSFNAIDAWKGRYVVHGLTIRDSHTNVRYDAKGKGNFAVTRDTASQGQAIRFDIRNINLNQTLVSYADDFNNQRHEFSASSLKGAVSIQNTLYLIEANGDITSHEVGIGHLIFFQNQTFDIKAALTYDAQSGKVLFKESKLTGETGVFDIQGHYLISEKPEMDLTLKARNTTLGTLLSFMPTSLVEGVKNYKSDGDLYLQMSVRGKVHKPSINIDFGAKNATFSHPETSFNISKANVKGSFSTVGLNHFRQARLQLKEVAGQLNGKPFTGFFDIQNFENPVVDFHFKGDVAMASLRPFFDQAYVRDATGEFSADIALQGEIEKLKSRQTAQDVKITGEVFMKNVALSTRLRNIALQGLNGTLQFTNNDLAMSEVRGRLGHSDFTLNGFFKNVVSYLLFDNQPIGIETDLRSNYLDLDELLQLAFGSDTTATYHFGLSPKLYLNFDCRVGRLKYQKFRALDLDGNLVVKNKVARTSGIKLKTMGGSLSLKGTLDARQDKQSSLATTAKMNAMHLDSIFYVFGNFRQNFIQDRHLKGLVTADVTLETDFTSDLKIVQPSLVADMDVTIKKGELNNFEPLQEMNRYLDDEGLKHLRFADLKNEIHIEKETILIPRMEVRTNVTQVLISGRHTFDQQIDYRIVAPLRNKKKINVDEAGNAFEVDTAGKMKVYFKITGTTENYKVAYDTDAVKKKIASDLKKEFTELKEAFQDKSKNKKKTLELEKDDYFDWEN